MKFRPPGVPLPKYALPGSDWNRPTRVKRRKKSPRRAPAPAPVAIVSPASEPPPMTTEPEPILPTAAILPRRKPYQGRPCPELDMEVTLRLEALNATEDTADLPDDEKLRTVLEDVTLLSASDHVGIASDADRRAWRRIQREARKRLDAMAGAGA